MDFNNISDRIKRLQASIGTLVDKDIERHIEVLKSDMNSPEISVNFNKKGEHEAINKVLIILHNLASLKDQLKKKLEIRNEDKNLIEQEINNNKALQIVLDLVNAEKHSYPVKFYPRSGLNPKLGKIHQAIKLSDENKLSIELYSNKYYVEGEPIIKIIGDVLDQNDKYICSINELISVACNKWEEVIKKYNLGN